MTAASEQRCLIHSTMGDCPFCRIDEANARADEAAALLAECSDRLRKAIVAAGTDEEHADIAVQQYRAWLDARKD